MKRNNYYHSEINIKDNKNWPIIKVTHEQIEIIKRYNNSKKLSLKKYRQLIFSGIFQEETLIP